MHSRHIGSFYRQKRLQHCHCPILRMSVNRASMIFSSASQVMQILIGCRHPLMRYWQSVGAKTTATDSLPHPENERQQRINSSWSCIIGNQGNARIFEHITELLTASIGKNTISQRTTTDSKIVDIANCQTCTNKSLAVEYSILIRYYYQTATWSALYASIDGNARWPANNLPDSDEFGNFNRTIPKLMIPVYWQSGPPIWQQFGLDMDSDLQWLSGAVANTTGNPQHKQALYWKCGNEAPWIAFANKDEYQQKVRQKKNGQTSLSEWRWVHPD